MACEKDNEAFDDVIISLFIWCAVQQHCCGNQPCFWRSDGQYYKPQQYGTEWLTRWRYLFVLMTLLLSLLTVPPNLSGGPDNLVVNAADTVSFCHQVQGTPTPSIQWEHNNKQLLHSARVKITNDGINVSLTILDVGRLDEGVYTCTALNSLGSMSAQTKLVVLGKC